MSAAPSGPDPLAARPARLAARVSPVHMLAAAGLAAVVGMVALQAVALPGPRPLTEGDRLRIEVVRPVEPDIIPGSVMDVGELVEGFQGVPRAPVREAVGYGSDGDWNDRRAAPKPAPPPRRRFEEAVIEAPREQPGPSAGRPVRDRWFGFDAPRRDYRAEREARRARREARIEWERQRAWERDREQTRRYRSDPDRERADNRERQWSRERGGEDERWREAPPPQDDFPPPGRWD